MERAQGAITHPYVQVPCARLYRLTMDRLPTHYGRQGQQRSQVIYHSPRFKGYVASLVLCKCILAYAYFLSYNILNYLHVVQFLFIARLVASTALVIIQKPFSSGSKLTRSQWLRVLRHAVINSSLTLLELFGLTLCGPLRTILLTQHKDLVVIVGVKALFTSAGGHSKFRGAVCFILAVLSLLFLDFDDKEALPTEHPEGYQHHGLSHIFYYLVSLLGLPDHKGGVLLLALTLCLQTGFRTISRTLAVDVGGAKRLNALSSVMSTLLLAPLLLFVKVPASMNQEVFQVPFFVLPLVFSGLAVFVLDYYVESVCTLRLDSYITARLGSLTVFTAALLLAFSWGTNSHTGHSWTGLTSGQHSLSGGLIFAWIMFVLATLILSSPDMKGTKGTLVGYSSDGDPLYHFNGDAFHMGPGYSMLSVLRSGLMQIMKESDSRRIFYFLCINLMFTGVELLYGMWTNSLGLISDGFHMLFDCSALVMGLAAALLARRSATRTFPFGYGRVEVLSGFMNGLFLVVIAFMVFSEAITRLFDPPQIKTERLLTVSVAGLIVNLIGIVAFRHTHSHSHGASHSQSHAHSHAHSHGHSHMGANTNLQGVFLHILADTLGSVGVIVSSLLIDQFGLLVADPLCSVFIAVLIFVSVLPLLKHSSMILVLRTPCQLEGKKLPSVLSKVLKIEGVLSYRNEHFWYHTGDVLAGSLHVQISKDANSQKVLSQVTSLFKELGMQHFTVQVEKEEFFQHMSGLRASTNYYSNALLRSAAHQASNGALSLCIVKSI
ncbi:zinc transporter 5-like isoform X1 [Dermacentor silvarum]|uniref:zinc transporter 5-like isoform X1 n=2 Tax=Dermacentor silvarum TaxID=543639 RepID=UPI002100D384|nr:zinc transporter 5-like isoform X1 [Dermacentor silvarum]